MKQAVVTIKYDEEKLNAVKQYMGKKWMRILMRS